MNDLKKLFLFIIIISIFFKFSYSQCNSEEIRNLKKTALIIGEKQYKSSRLGVLNNTANDANDISDSLRKIGFETEPYIDIDLKRTKDVIEKWLATLKDYDVALFYFSGHGAEVEGTNYLFPIDAQPKDKFELGEQTIVANKIINDLNELKLIFSIVILDACRNNPITKSWTRNATNGGLSNMNAGKNMFIGYAAEPGKSALDGYNNNRNGIYTEAILKYITQPNFTIDQIFTKISKEVQTKTNQDQIPYRTSSLSTDFCFNVSNKNIGEDSSFIVSSSSLVTISNQSDEAFIIDSNKILIKGLRSNTSKYIHKDIIKPFKLIGGRRNIYILDSIQKSIFIIDQIKKEILDSIKLKYFPNSFTISRDEKKAYVTYKDSMYGGIATIDLTKQIIERYHSLKYPLFSIIVSNNGDKLYCFAKRIDISNCLYSIDTKRYKITDSIKTNSYLENLSISNDGALLFTNHLNGINKNIIVFNTKQLNLNDTIFIEGNYFNFTYDSNYVVITNKNSFVYRLRDKKQTNRFTWSEMPKGIVFSKLESYLWFPKTQRIFFKNLIGLMEKEIKDSLNADQKIKLFAERNKKIVDSKVPPKQILIKDVFGHLSNQINYVIDQIIKDIGGGDYKKIYNVISSDTLNRIYKVQIGISNKESSIEGTLECSIGNDLVYVTITDISMKKENFEYPFSDKVTERVKNDIIRPMTRNFFGNRIDNLQPNAL